MLVIKVLGELELELDQARLAPPPRKSGRLLLGYLALNPGLHARGDLAAELWPDVLESSARASLRSAIASVRRVLGADADRYLLRVGDTIGLSGKDAGVSVDAEQFAQLLADGKVAPALALSSGPLLQGLDAEWVRQRRAEHREKVGDLLATLARDAEHRGHAEQALRYVRRQVALAPLAELPNRELIRLLIAVGDRAAALAVYSEMAERFRRELRTVPSAQTRQLANEARRGPASARVDLLKLPLPAAVEAALREPFVDRLSEMAVLTAALERTEEGQGRTVLIVGEPGVGKSSLVAQFASVSASRARILLGRCRRPSSSVFEPFVESIRQYVSAAPAELLERELPAAASELCSLVPELAERLVATPLPADLLEDGGRVARAIIETLHALSRERPLILIVEDTHSGEADTFALIGQLLSYTSPTRLMLVLTFRDTEAGSSPRLQRLAREVRGLPGADYLPLAALDFASVGELAHSLRNDELSAEEVERLYERTQGNPLFVEQLARAPDPFASWPLPQRIQDVVLEQLARLGSETRTCLAVGAAVGLEFELKTVLKVAHCGERAALDALDEAVGAGLVRELPAGVGRYGFRHELIRDTLFGTLTATRRAYLHRDVARALVTGSGRDPTPWRLVIRHLRQAGDLVTSNEMCGHILRAAEAANHDRTYAAAACLYAEAAALLDDQPEILDKRIAALIGLGHARRRAGKADATQAFIEAGALAKRISRGDLVTSAALGLCSTPFFAGDRAPESDVRTLLEQAIEATPQSDLAARARLSARMAGELFYDSTRVRPDELALQAVALARRAGKTAALLAALDIGHLAFRGPDGPHRRLQLAEEVIALARERGETESLVPALVHRTVNRVALGDLDAFTENANTLLRLSQELAQPAYTWWTELWRASAAIVVGRLDEGAELARRAFDAGRTGFGASAGLELRAQLLWLHIERGQLDHVAQRLPELEQTFSLLPVWGSLKARVLAEIGNRDEAATTVRNLIKGGIAQLERDTNWLISAALLTETVARISDAQAAEQLIAVLKPRADHWAISARGTVCLGPVAGSLAVLSLVVDSSPEQAQSYYKQAIQQCRTSGARPAEARLEREYRHACKEKSAR